jgi:DNA-binding CsgD family transcriptional regulator
MNSSRNGAFWRSLVGTRNLQITLPIGLCPCEGGSEGLAKSVLHMRVSELNQERRMLNLDAIKITPRDEEVLRLLAQGCSNKAIAGHLNISPRTVRADRQELPAHDFRQTGVWSRLELALYVAGHGGVNWVTELGLEDHAPSIPMSQASSVA